jgi:glycosyltransferase involved in cell wall biosynthesis
MKIAILHASITEGNNGSEKLVYEVARQFNSKIYLCDFDESMETSYPGIGDMVVLDKIEHPDSFTRREFEIRKVMMKRKDIDADFIMYSTPMPCHRIEKDSTPYIYFCHTPERGFFDLKEMVKKEMVRWGFPRFQIAWALFNYRKRLDMRLFKDVVNSKQVVTNSELIVKRYEKSYGKRPRRAVGAPVDTTRFRNKPSEDFLFTSGGLRPNKRVEWQIRAIAGTGQHLKIAGDGVERKKLEDLAGKLNADVEFLGRVSDRELIDLYSSCKAFVFSAIEEDFGMVPIEAMASGKPVICVNEGGPLEYLDDKVAYFFDDIDGLRKILSGLSMPDLDSKKNDCLARARRFDSRVVSDRIMTEIKGILNEFY